MKHFSAFAAAFAGLLAAPALAQTVPPPAISVTGEAHGTGRAGSGADRRRRANDAKTAREASDANNAAMGKVLLALKGAGIDEKDFQTSRLSLQPQYAPNRSGPSPIVGYRAANRVTDQVRDVTKVAASSTCWSARRQRHRRHQLHGLAGLETARRGPRAGDCGCAPQGADLRQGCRRHARRAARISEKARRPDVSRQGRPGMVAATAPVAQGEETLSVTVNVSWAIKPKE
jgi:uncharacterized protein YggE